MTVMVGKYFMLTLRDKDCSQLQIEKILYLVFFFLYSFFFDLFFF